MSSAQSQSQFSVYIPRIFTNIPNSKIISTFENLDLGKVQYMDIVYRTGADGSTYKMAFIHFSYWSNNSSAINLRDRIEDPEIEAKLVYDDPWYWLILPNKSPTSRQHKANTQVDLNDCYNRIISMSNKLNDVYNGLFINNSSSSTEYDIESFEDIESGDSTRMTMSQLGIPLHHNPYKYGRRTDSSYDEQMSVSSDGFDDLEVGGNPGSHAILISDNKIQLKHWITENICGNA